MLLSYRGCRIVIEENSIKCSYTGHFNEERWQITLDDTHIGVNIEGNKKLCFKVNEIQEFQFEMGNGAYRNGDIPAAIAYVILKSDPDPKKLFYFSISEEYVMLNQTKAHDFCNTILNYIGEKYNIPVTYKISIDTQKKRNAVALAPLMLVIIFVLIWLMLHFGH